MRREAKRIVLYYPQLADETRGHAVSKHLLPLSLLTIAGLPAREGYEVVLIDGNLYPQEEAHRKVVEACEGALLYATTGILGFQVADGYTCTRKVKRRHTDLPAFIGGWFASASPQLQLETGLYEAVALGQGELTFLDMIHAVEAGEPLDDVPGLAVWRDGALVHTPPRAVVGWDRLSAPAWDLLEWDLYREHQLRPGHGDALETMPPPPRANGRPYTAISYFSSFGCPLPCAFCCSPDTTGRRWKAMPADRMLDDIAELQDRWGFDIVHFHDANWGVGERRVREFADGVLERGLEFDYFAYMQSDSVLRYKPETLDAMAESGMYLAVVGAETGSDDTMAWIGKPMRGDENIRAARELDRRGISVQASYLIGFPREDEDSMLQTLEQCRRMAVECPFASPMVWRYHPIPGAAMYAMALEDGFEPPRTLENWGSFYDYKLGSAWPGRVSPRVERLHRLYNHFTHVANGLARGRIGFWERRARKRLADQTGFARGWPLGGLEAKVFDLAWRLERRLRPRGHELGRGWRSGEGRGIGVPPTKQAREVGA